MRLLPHKEEINRCQKFQMQRKLGNLALVERCIVPTRPRIFTCRYKDGKGIRIPAWSETTTCIMWKVLCTNSTIDPCQGCIYNLRHSSGLKHGALLISLFTSDKDAAQLEYKRKPAYVLAVDLRLVAPRLQISALEGSQSPKRQPSIPHARGCYERAQLLMSLSCKRKREEAIMVEASKTNRVALTERRM